MLSLSKASSVFADSDPADKPGDGGGHTLPGGPLRQRPQQDRE